VSLRLKGSHSKQLLELVRKLKATGELRDALSRNMAEAALDLVKEGFSQQSDPWGTKWAPLKLRSGRIGRDSGGMLQSLHVSERSRSGFTLAFTKHYAKYFHGGTGIYGPTKQRIRPKRARVLAFGVRGAKGTKGGRGKKAFVFRSVKGSPPRPVFPEGGRTPPHWRVELKATADDVVRRFMR
jgi:phage gpG-like protein